MARTTRQGNDTHPQPSAGTSPPPSGVTQTSFEYKSPFTDGTPGLRPPMDPGMLWRDIGSSGLRQYSGWVREEFLRALQGREAARVFREMRDNSATVGALLFALQQAMRRIDWHVVAPSDSAKAREKAEFVESIRHDMSNNFEEFLTEAFSCLEFGFSLFEIVWKRRTGYVKPAAYNVDGNPINSVDRASSRYNDGLIGVRRLAMRGQETILRWYFDSNGAITGVQQQPWIGPLIDIPIEKLLLFRPTQYKGNPEGRALDPDTLIPTPDGWRELDSLTVGNKVFDETGKIRYITARADWNDRPCYKVKFLDGCEIVADANHQWVTSTLKERTLPFVHCQARTTEEISKTLKTSQKSSNHAIPWAASLDYPEQYLPLDPYVLGLWLGDGWSRSAMLSCHVQDLEEEIELVEAAGYSVEAKQNRVLTSNGRALRFFGSKKWASGGPSDALRVLGLFQNKHIPECYLRASINQRLALLSGLMDSDGHVDSLGRCEFCNTNYNLIRGVAELVQSLGIGVKIATKSFHPTRKLPTWAVKFTPTWPPFRLSRKAARCKIDRARKFHYIVAVEPVESRRTVCIEVDSPSHLFLAGESMIPTHNSILRNSYRCFSEDTEILTQNGWVFLKDLDRNVQVATLQPESRQVEYQYITNYYSYPFNGRLCHFEGQYFDQLVTPNHRMYVRPVGITKHFFVEAQHIAAGVFIRTGFDEDCEELSGVTTPVDYSGMVYCVEVPNSTVFVRRNGKSSWSGNSYYFAKRIEEEEAILFERMNGLPILKVPSALLEAAAAGDVNATQTLDTYKKMVTNVRIDEQMGLILPSDMWPGVNGPSSQPMFNFELAAPTGRMRVDSDKVLHRYSLDILKTVLADFIDLGHQARGTQNLAISKVDMFYSALQGWLKLIASTLNRYLLTRLWTLNGFDFDLMPQFQPDVSQRYDLADMGNFIKDLAAAGALTPDADLEAWLRDSAGLPAPSEEPTTAQLADYFMGGENPQPQPGQDKQTPGQQTATSILAAAAQQSKTKKPTTQIRTKSPGTTPAKSGVKTNPPPRMRRILYEGKPPSKPNGHITA